MVTTFLYAAVRFETDVQVWASSPPASPPKEMITLPPADLMALIWLLNAPTESPPSSHCAVQPDLGVRNASV